MVGPTPRQLEEYRNKIRDHLRTYGWHAQGVFDPETGFTYTYTVGVTEHCGGPELVLVGLALDVAQPTLADIVQKMETGGLSLQNGSVISNIIAHFDLVAVQVSPRQVRENFSVLSWYREEGGHPERDILQLVWPDATGLFPWDKGFDARFLKVQPIWGDTTLARRRPRQPMPEA